MSALKCWWISEDSLKQQNTLQDRKTQLHTWAIAGVTPQPGEGPDSAPSGGTSFLLTPRPCPLPGDLPPEPREHSTSPRKPSQTPPFPHLHCPFSPHKTKQHTGHRAQRGHLLTPTATEGMGGCPRWAGGWAARVESASPLATSPGAGAPPRASSSRAWCPDHKRNGRAPQGAGRPGNVDRPLESSSDPFGADPTSQHLGTHPRPSLQGPSSPPPGAPAQAPFTPNYSQAHVPGRLSLTSSSPRVHTNPSRRRAPPAQGVRTSWPANPAPPGWATCGSPASLMTRQPAQDPPFGKECSVSPTVKQTEQGDPPPRWAPGAAGAAGGQHSGERRPHCPQDRAAGPAGETGDPQLGQGGLTHGRRVTPEDRHQLQVPEPVIGPNPWGGSPSPQTNGHPRDLQNSLFPQTPSLAKRSQWRQRLW